MTVQCTVVSGYVSVWVHLDNKIAVLMHSGSILSVNNILLIEVYCCVIVKCGSFSLAEICMIIGSLHCCILRL